MDLLASGVVAVRDGLLIDLLEQRASLLNIVAIDGIVGSHVVGKSLALAVLYAIETEHRITAGLGVTILGLGVVLDVIVVQAVEQIVRGLVAGGAVCAELCTVHGQGDGLAEVVVVEDLLVGTIVGFLL